MRSEVFFLADFKDWWDKQTLELKHAVLVAINSLEDEGLDLSRTHIEVDSHMIYLRVVYRGQLYFLGVLTLNKQTLVIGGAYEWLPEDIPKMKMKPSHLRTN